MKTLPRIPLREETWQHVTIILDAQTRLKHLGRELRLEYDRVTHERLPRDMARLLMDLERREPD
jgi:hypothetical protein